MSNRIERMTCVTASRATKAWTCMRTELIPAWISAEARTEAIYWSKMFELFSTNVDLNVFSSDSHFPSNHALGMLSNLSALNMGVQNLQNFQQHSDVLEKIKMQVRDMKVGFMNSDFSALHPSFTSTLQSSLGFNPAQSLQNSSIQSSSGNNTNSDSPNNFAFTSSTPAVNKDGKLKIIWILISLYRVINDPRFLLFAGSNSSTSSETSNSSQQNNGWSFEEQFKQVRQVSLSLCASSSRLSTEQACLMFN